MPFLFPERERRTPAARQHGHPGQWELPTQGAVGQQLPSAGGVSVGQGIPGRTGGWPSPAHQRFGGGGLGLGLGLKISMEAGGAKARGPRVSKGQTSDLTGGRRLEQMTSLHPAAQGDPTLPWPHWMAEGL